MTIYGYIDQRFGETSRIAVSCMFLIGRLLASGARLIFCRHSGLPADIRQVSSV